jgi:hypothetical protein
MKTLIKLKELISAYGWQFIIEILAILLIVLIQVINLFFPTFFQNINLDMIFKIIVLLCLGDILYKLISFGKKENYRLGVFDSESKELIIKTIFTKNINKAVIISAGLGSRVDLIFDLAKHNINIEVLYQDPKYAIDCIDPKRTEERRNFIQERLSDINKKGKCTFFPYKSPASLRGVLLEDHNQRVVFAQLGWYLYHSNKKIKNNFHLRGDIYPSFILDNMTIAENHSLSKIFDHIKKLKNESK